VTHGQREMQCAVRHNPPDVYGSVFPGETFRVLATRSARLLVGRSPVLGGKEKELNAYGNAAQSDEEIGVGEVGRVGGMRAEG
jgi:hypothetical protein